MTPRQAILDTVHHNTGGPRALHPRLRRCVAPLIDDAIEIGLNVLESVQPEPAGMNPYELKRRWGKKLTFWGGLGAQSILPFGTPAAIQAEIRQLRREMSRDGGYILAPSKNLQPGTPLANAVATLEAFTEENM